MRYDFHLQQCSCPLSGRMLSLPSISVVKCWGPSTAFSPGMLIGKLRWPLPGVGVWDSPQQQHAAGPSPTCPLFLQVCFQHFCTKRGLSLMITDGWTQVDVNALRLTL